MKRRVTYTAVLLVLADVLLLGAVWRLAPALSLTAALAVPEVEPLLAPLYAEPHREDVTVDVAGTSHRADLYRPARALAGLVLVRTAASAEGEAERLARLLARRSIAVVLPRTAEGGVIAPAVARDYAHTLRVPLHVASLDALRSDGAPRASLADRLRELRRLFSLATSLFSA